VEWADLSNQSSDSISGLNWEVAANTTISINVAGTGDIIALDSIAAIPEPTCIAFMLCAGLCALITRRFTA
jgi:hypothetical protein